MKKYAIAFLLGSTIIGSSCGQNRKNSPEHDALYTEEIRLEDIPSEKGLRADISKTKELSITPSENNEEAKTAHSQHKKIIRSGKLSIESKDIAKTKKLIDEQLKALGGYYELENTSSISNYSTYNLEIRIPSKNFDTLLENIERGNDKITDKSIQSKDITLQYIDLESRVKSKKAYLERYQQMVASAKTTKDLLEIEEQIRQLQEDIESNANLLKSLADQVDYSILNINIYYAETGNINNPNPFISEVGDALSDGWVLIKNCTLGIIAIWPIILVIIIGFLGWKKYRKRKGQ